MSEARTQPLIKTAAIANIDANIDPLLSMNTYISSVYQVTR